MRLAWFSPLPPTRSGIAAYSAELLPKLEAGGHSIDRFVESTAHEFVWTARRRPYDLIVYQLGNALCHNYMWGYMFRYPGLVTLHDAQLHQSRAMALTGRRWEPRRRDYLDEFTANHPQAPAAVGELIAAGLGGSLYTHWPHIRLVVESARTVVVHNHRLGDDLREQHPGASIEVVPMGVSDPLDGRAPGTGAGHARPAAAAIDIRRRHGIRDGAVVLAAFGGVTPEKRVGALLDALRIVGDRCPELHLLLVGERAEHYDVLDEARQCGVSDRVTLTGFVADADLPAYLLSADICACLRWPTNRETSASWLRCLAAGRATLVTDLADLVDVPTLDPRTWQPADSVRDGPPAVAVSIDIVDERRSLELALERLYVDRTLRTALGAGARAWWQAHHQLDAMALAYGRVLAAAAHAPAPRVDLPPHLTDDGSRRARELARQLGVSNRLSDVLDEHGLS